MGYNGPSEPRSARYIAYIAAATKFFSAVKCWMSVV